MRTPRFLIACTLALAGALAGGCGGVASTTPDAATDAAVSAVDAARSVDAARAVVDASLPSSIDLATLPSSPQTLGFPVSGVWATGGDMNQFAKSAFQDGVSKYNFVFLGWFLGLEQSMGAHYDTVMSSIKTKATAAGNPSCKTGLYVMEEEWHQSTSTPGFFGDVILDALDTNSWFLKNPWPSGSNVVQEQTFYVVNLTDTTKIVDYPTVGSIPGPGLVDCPQFIAYWQYNSLVAGNAVPMGEPTATFANSQLDFVIHDNQLMVPYYGGSWLSTPTTYPGFDAAAAAPVVPHLSHGYRQLLDEWRSLAPSVKHAGNLDHFNYYPNTNYDPSIAKQYDYPFAENPLGSFEKYGGADFNTLIAGLVSQEYTLKQGGYAVLQMEGPTFGTYWTGLQSTFASSDWQAWRYGAGIAALLRWMICPPAPQTSAPYWFDELDDAGAGVNWLGAPLGERSLTKWLDQGKYGIWRAQFEHGTVYVNPKGNGVQTFAAAGHRIGYHGHGDASVNTGAAFSSLTLQDRDAIFVTP